MLLIYAAVFDRVRFFITCVTGKALFQKLGSIKYAGSKSWHIIKRFSTRTHFKGIAIDPATNLNGKCMITAA